MCLAQGPQRSDTGEARTRGLSVSSQALYHWATALPATLKWEIVNVSFFPGCRFFPFRLYSLVFKFHECADPEGGGAGGPDPHPW